jgi:hypothetical protein
MSEPNYNELKKLLEKEALSTVNSEDDVIEVAIITSIAISLKRIADRLDDIHLILRRPPRI